MILSEDKIEAYAEEYSDIPAILRKRQMFTFYDYVKSREFGFHNDDIIKSLMV